MDEGSRSTTTFSKPQRHLAFAQGEVLANRYEIRRPLGSGGMGDVVLAFDLRLRVEVALKALRVSGGELLHREIRTAREVISPNVCRIFDLVEGDGLEFLSMEYVDGVTLREILAERVPLDLLEAQQIAAQFLAGLEAIHGAGFVHRDFKPSNVMITRTGRVVVMDFGLAKPLADAAGSVAGTPAYMPPEQLRGEKLDARADVYAAGMVLSKMLPPDENAPWAGVLARACAPDAAQRYPSAAALSRALEDVSFCLADVERRNPYPGLSSFIEEDAEHFFGREAEVEAIWRKLGGPARLLGVIGPSGAGKSSLLRAGLIAAAPPEWRIAYATPGNRPFAALGRALLAGLSDGAVAHADLLQFDEPGTALRVLNAWRGGNRPALVIIDQFEELFTQNREEHQRDFAALLGRLPTDADTHVLLSVRDDFLVQCHRFESLAPLFSDLTPVLAPTGDALRRAIVQPALKSGLRFEDETLVDTIIEAVSGERGALPLVAFAMARLWEKRDRNRGLLTREAYEEIGGVAGALAQHAEATMERIGSDRIPIVRELFRNLVTAQGTRAARDRSELLSVFPEHDRVRVGQVLDHLIDARLLTSYESEAVRIEIVHESLLAKWPRLVHWQTQDAEGAQLRDELRQAARLWEQHDRSDDFLWRGTAYREFQLWRDRYRGNVTSIEEEFARAMTARAQRHRRQRLVAFAAILGVAITIAAATILLWRQAETQARRATAAKLLALAQVELESDATAALAYATKSLEVADSEQARRFAVKALWRGPTAVILPLPGADWFQLAFSPDEKWLATSSFAENVLVFPSSGRRPIVLGGHETTGDKRHMEFGPRSDVLVTKTGRTDPLRIWSIPAGRLLRKLPVEGEASFLLRAGEVWMFDAPNAPSVRLRRWRVSDGALVDLWNLDSEQPLNNGNFDVDINAKWLAFARGKNIVLRDLRSFQQGSEKGIGSHAATVAALLFGSNGTLLSRDKQGEIRLWLVDGKTSPLLRVIQGAPSDLSPRLNATASRVAAADPTNHIIRVWDLRAIPEAVPLELRRGDRDVGQIDRLEFTTKWLAAAQRTSVSFWPLTKEYARVFRGHANTIRRVRFAPDGRWVVSASLDGSVRLWPLHPRAGTTSRVVLARNEYCYGLAVDPTGQTILIGNTGKNFLAAADGKTEPIRLEPSVGAPNAAVFDRTGRRAALGCSYSPSPDKHVIRIWDVKTAAVVKDLHLLQEQDPGVPAPYQGGVNDVKFAPDGSLYSAGYGGVRQWDVDRDTSRTLMAGNFVVMELSDDGRHLLTVTSAFGHRTPSTVRYLETSGGISRTLSSHGSDVVSVALDSTGTIAVTGGADGTIRVGRATGEEPHLLFGHHGAVIALAVSPDGRWIASGGQDSTVRIWPMPDLSKPPLHTLPHDRLIAKLKTLTNLRVVEEATAPNGYKFDYAPFPGWEKVPEW